MIIIYFIILIKVSFQEIYAMLDRLYNDINISTVSTFNCPNLDENNFYYRGSPENILNIIDKYEITDFNNTIIEGYKYVYIPDMQNYYQKVIIFPKSTILIVNEKIKKNIYNEKYCFLFISSIFGSEREHFYDNKKYKYLLVLGCHFQNMDNINLFFTAFFMPLMAIILCIYYYKMFYLKSYKELQFYILTKRIILLSILLILSNIFIASLNACSLIHSLFKSYMIINLIILLNGYSIINFENQTKSYFALFLFLFLFDSFFNIVLEYIVYFLPELDNLYLFIIKSLIEHLILLEYAIKTHRESYMHLYKQYEFELKLKSILVDIYENKLIIYKRIIIFSYIYCSIFIIFQLIKLIFLSQYINSFCLNYFINTYIEVFFTLILVILFFPNNLGIYFYIPVLFDYGTEILRAQIKYNSDELSIANLHGNLKENKFKETKCPLLFINPFSRNNNLFNDLHLGEVIY